MLINSGGYNKIRPKTSFDSFSDRNWMIGIVAFVLQYILYEIIWLIHSKVHPRVFSEIFNATYAWTGVLVSLFGVTHNRPGYQWWSVCCPETAISSQRFRQTFCRSNVQQIEHFRRCFQLQKDHLRLQPKKCQCQNEQWLHDVGKGGYGPGQSFCNQSPHELPCPDVNLLCWLLAGV